MSGTVYGNIGIPSLKERSTRGEDMEFVRLAIRWNTRHEAANYRHYVPS